MGDVYQVPAVQSLQQLTLIEAQAGVYRRDWQRVLLAGSKGFTSIQLPPAI